MKKLSLSVLAATLLFSACKKGENDPSISLVSRKARVAGEWNVDKMVSTDNSVSGTTTYADAETFDGTTYTSTSSVTSGGTPTTETITGTIAKNTVTFTKDGTFTMEANYTTTETQTSGGGYTEVTTKVYTNKTEGSWNFLGKVDEFKNKERIVLNYTKGSSSVATTTVTTFGGSSTTTTGSNSSDFTYNDGEASEVWAIDRLASKEMIVKSDKNSTYASSTTSGGTTTTNTYNSTGVSEITLSQE